MDFSGQLTFSTSHSILPILQIFLHLCFLQCDFETPTINSWDLFSHPLNLGLAFAFLEPSGCDRSRNVPIQVLVLRELMFSARVLIHQVNKPSLFCWK